MRESEKGSLFLLPEAYKFVDRDGETLVLRPDMTPQTARCVAKYFKKEENGLVPVIVQDYKTNEVLMLAYMNEEAYNCTIRTGKMTYLAKVKQIGVACHTGNRSCFYRELLAPEWETEDSTNILERVYTMVMDRKVNPKEGSYTNYLFDKGIDKILKKCGEEATEIVIAAKNPDKSEIQYEIADFLYHVTVLMAECNLDWKDVFEELANRD